MARRMFATEIVNSDHFLDMPSSTQALYFHLGMHCDDDGFVYPKKVMRMIGASEDDLKILIGKKFVLPFESGIYVQKHWRVNNYIRPDRYHPTTHTREKEQLLADGGGVYHLVTSRLPVGSISKEVRKKESRSANAKEGDAKSGELTREERAAKMASVRENLRHTKKM